MAIRWSGIFTPGLPQNVPRAPQDALRQTALLMLLTLGFTQWRRYDCLGSANIANEFVMLLMFLMLGVMQWRRYDREFGAAWVDTHDRHAGLLGGCLAWAWFHFLTNSDNNINNW